MEVKVNGRIITEREIARETQYHPADSFEAARRKAAEALVVRELLLQQASRLGIEGEFPFTVQGVPFPPLQLWPRIAMPFGQRPLLISG